MNKQKNHILSRTAFIIMALMMISSLMHKLLLIEDNHLDYINFTISDWMINYEGGFVRRGLIGQILLYIYNIHPYPLIQCITSIYIIGFILLLCLTLNVFKKQGWSPIIIPSFLCFYYGFGWGTQLLSVRRDYYMLLLIYLLFKLYSKWQQTGKYYHIITINILSAIIILTYEPTFFYCIPLLTIITFYNSGKETTLKSRFKKTILLWLPSYILMAIVCLNKGNQEQATAIWNSWIPCMQAFPCGTDITQIGDGVNFFNKPIGEVLEMHFNTVWNNNFMECLPSFIFIIYTFVSIIYLIIKLNIIDMNTWNLKKTNTILLTDILLIEFIFVSPMYGLLSSDLGRTVTCIVISSLFAYHIFNDKSIIIPRYIIKLSISFNRFINRYKIFSNPYLYIFILFTLPLSAYNGVQFESMMIIQILKIIYNVL